MYGGHVVEGWDRRLVASYLESLLSPALLESGRVCPGLALPPAGATHAQVARYIQETAPAEGAAPLGLHPNAEVGVALRAADELCAALKALQGDSNSIIESSSSASASPPVTVEDRARAAMDAVLEALPPRIDVESIRAAAATAAASGDSAVGGNSSGGGAPYATVVLQEADRMNALLGEVRSSLAELALGLKGDLAMSERMEAMAAALATDRVPPSWAAAAYPSLRALGPWVRDLGARHAQLAEWGAEPAALPPSVWLPGLFNPAAFLTAVLQVAARKAGWALDATSLVTEVTRKAAAGGVDAPPREGAYVHGERGELAVRGCSL